MDTVKFVDSFYGFLYDTFRERILADDFIGLQHSITYALFTMRDFMDAKGGGHIELKNPDHAKFLDFIKGLIPQICARVESDQANLSNIKADHEFIKALTLYGMTHSFSPEHVCEILARQLAK